MVSVAHLTDDDRALFGTTARDLRLSRTSLDEHKARHPEITAEDYLRIPQLVREAWFLSLVISAKQKPPKGAVRIR